MRDQQFDQLLHAHYRSVFAYARSLTGSAPAAEDATQETFLRAWRYLDSFRGSGSFEGWLLRICKNCVYDLAKRTSAATKISNLRATPIQPADYAPETMLMLDELQLEHREVLVLCGLLGYDYESAATVLGVPIGTVRSRLHRAREAFAKAMNVEDHDIA